MTPEQQRLVRYAEVMGWKLWKETTREPETGEYYWLGPSDTALKIVRQHGADFDSTVWNPLTDANDALELAEKLGVAFEYRPTTRVQEERYAAWLDPLEYCTPTLPAAICAAVDAVLDAV